VRFLATTNRGLETVANEEIQSLVGGSPSLHHPGMVEFEAADSAVGTLHNRARSLHRVFIERSRGRFDSLDDIYDIARGLDITALLGSAQSFAVRAQRHGDHEFGSPGVERVVGQAIIDSSREARNVRPPVDLEDPAVIFRILVRHDRVVIAVDATGQQSMHRRWYRKVEHDAALRPTLAYAMLHLADYRGNERLADPMCGTGTIPIEAALLAANRSPTRDHDPAFHGFDFLDVNDWNKQERDDIGQSGSVGAPSILGRDVSEHWIRGARENAAAAGVSELIEFETADATARETDTEVVVTDLPFGVRTEKAALPQLYREAFGALGTDWETLVVLTAREDLVPHDPRETYSLRRGRLEVSLLVID